MNLTTLSNRVAELRGVTVADAAQALTDLYPDLEKLTSEERIGDDNLIDLLTRALRAVRPRALRCDSPEQALKALREALDEGPRAPGRPPSARPKAEGRTVRLYRDVDLAVVVLAAQTGVTPNDLIATLVERAIDGDV